MLAIHLTRDVSVLFLLRSRFKQHLCQNSLSLLFMMAVGAVECKLEASFYVRFDVKGCKECCANKSRAETKQ